MLCFFVFSSSVHIQCIEVINIWFSLNWLVCERNHSFGCGNSLFGEIEILSNNAINTNAFLTSRLQQRISMILHWYTLCVPFRPMPASVDLLDFFSCFVHIVLCMFSFSTLVCDAESILKCNAFSFFFNTIIYSRQMAGPTGAITAEHNEKETEHGTVAKTEKKWIKHTENETEKNTSRRHTRRSRVLLCRAQAKERLHPLLVWSQLFLIVVCDLSNCWVLLLFCYIKWTMACMSPAPINTCDIWCETCISWFLFVVVLLLFASTGCCWWWCSSFFGSFFSNRRKTARERTHTHRQQYSERFVYKYPCAFHFQSAHIVSANLWGLHIRQSRNKTKGLCLRLFMWLMKIDNISMAYNYNWLILSSGESCR